VNKIMKEIEKQPITRRSLIDWMGKSLVLALGSSLVAACGSLQDDESFIEDPKGISFEPGNSGSKIYADWYVRTIDTQDLSSILQTWKLTIDGMVKNPGVYDFNSLIALKRNDQTANFHCVEGWTVPGVPWNDVHLSTLFAMAEPLAGATHVTFHTIGGTYNESLSMEDALDSRTMVAYGVNGSTLPLNHGFPLRLVVPYKWGYKSAKYVYRIELTDGPISGFWVDRGYSYEGNVPEDRLRFK